MQMITTIGLDIAKSVFRFAGFMLAVEQRALGPGPITVVDPSGLAHAQRGRHCHKGLRPTGDRAKLD